MAHQGCAHSALLRTPAPSRQSRPRPPPPSLACTTAHSQIADLFVLWNKTLATGAYARPPAAAWLHHQHPVPALPAQSPPPTS